jgi:hypothetical protein
VLYEPKPQLATTTTQQITQITIPTIASPQIRAQPSPVSVNPNDPNNNISDAPSTTIIKNPSQKSIFTTPPIGANVLLPANQSSRTKKITASPIESLSQHFQPIAIHSYWVLTYLKIPLQTPPKKQFTDYAHNTIKTPIIPIELSKV